MKDCYDVPCDAQYLNDNGECERAFGMDVEWGWVYGKVIMRVGITRIDLSTREALTLIAKLSEAIRENA